MHEHDFEAPTPATDDTVEAAVSDYEAPALIPLGSVAAQTLVTAP
ncbi:MAG TPA: hypothetical protein VJT75_04525 [Thermoleophilaceae bacterium]|nr:hypothetical protein [Thermoleophilaceae bacterium]